MPTHPTDDVEKGEQVSSLPQDNEVQEPGGNWKRHEVHVLPPNKMIIVFPALIFTLFLAALDSTVVATALPTIVSDLGGTGSYSWIGAVYLLAPACFAPLYGKLSDLVGRKPVLLFNMAAFAVGSALCGSAQTFEWLIVARAIQGVGGGGIFQLVNIALSDITTLEERGKYMGGVAAAWSLASLVGPLIGGALAEHSSWRVAFYMNLPPTVIAIVVLAFFLKLNPTPKKTIAEILRVFDLTGMLLLSTATVCLLLAFQFPGTDVPWSAPEVIALLVVGTVLLILAVTNEFMTKKQPILPPRLFTTRTTAGTLVGTFCMQFSWMSTAFYLPLYFQIIGWSATLSGLLITPYAMGSSLVALISGYVITRQGKYKPTMVFGFAVNTLGLGLLIMLDEKTGLAQQIIFLLITALGLGCLYQSPNIAIQASMPLAEMATSMTALFIVRMMAGVLGICLGGTLFTSGVRSQLDALGYHPPEGHRIDDIRDLHDIQPPQLKEQVVRAYVLGLRNFWILLTPLSFVGLLATLMLRNYTLKRTVVHAKDEKPPTTTDTSASPEPASPQTASLPAVESRSAEKLPVAPSDSQLESPLSFARD